MPAPLIWLGIGIGSAIVGHQLSRHSQKSANVIQHFPGDVSTKVKPQNGSIVCCGVYELFDHSGIWFDGEIIELNGNGLIRSVSPQRFLNDRSGEQIFVVCDRFGEPLVSETASEKALSQVYQYRDYHVLNNNCHRFVWSCISQINEPITLFSDLNHKLSRHFATSLSWHPAFL